MLTKKQTILCINKCYGPYKDKKKLAKELEKSDKALYTDEEVQKLQENLARMAERNSFPRTDAEWDAYDSIHHNGGWHSASDSRYDSYNGRYESIWD